MIASNEAHFTKVPESMQEKIKLKKDVTSV